MQKNSSDKIIRQKIKGKSTKYFYLLFFTLYLFTLLHCNAGDFYGYSFRKFGYLVGLASGCSLTEVTTIDFIYLSKIAQIVQ